MSLPDPLPIRPWTRPCRGAVSLPGSKSLTNRALVMAALRQGRTRLDGALFSRDSRLLMSGLKALGIKTEANPTEAWIDVHGTGGTIPADSAEIHVGNAGTVARFLSALVCLRPGGTFRFDGDEEMRRRPMAGLLRCLESLGTQFTFEGEEGCFPFVARTAGLPGGSWKIDAAASSQMLSALMMVAPFAGGAVAIEATGARPAFVRMTASIMRQFGLQIDGDPASGYRVPAGQAVSLDGSVYAIEPDATAASYFMLLPFVAGGSLLIRGMRDGMLQGDVAFAGVLREIGFTITSGAGGWQVDAPPHIEPKPRGFDFETFSDTFLSLAAVAPLLPCPVAVTGIGHTRHQETDRIAAMEEGLARSGARVEAAESSLLVHPYGPGEAVPGDVVINTYKDHRLAMSFAVLGSRDRRGDGQPWLSVADPLCCRKTFPAFFDVLSNLYQESHDN